MVRQMTKLDGNTMGRDPRPLSMVMFFTLLTAVLSIFGCQKEIEEIPSYSYSDYWSPWVTKTTTDNATINWRGRSDASGVVHYDNTDYYTTNHEFRYSISTTNDDRYQHVKIDRLDEDMSYTYQVKLDDGHLFGVHSFRTMPESGPFKFIVISDPQEGHNYNLEDRFKYVAEAVAKEPDVAFVLCGGDYTRFDAVKGWCRFFQVALPMISKIAIFPTIGNHEYHKDGGAKPTGADHYRWSFDVPLYYSFDCANIRFCVLASPDPNSAKKDDPQTSRAYAESQAGWLYDQLNNQLAGNFTIQHDPIWNAGNNARDENLGVWDDYFRQFNISANFSGHRHNYQRFFVDGIPYFIVGTAGGACSKVDEPHPDGFIIGENRHLGYLRVYVDPEAGTARAEQVCIGYVTEDDSGTLPVLFQPPQIHDSVDFPLQSSYY